MPFSKQAAAVFIRFISFLFSFMQLLQCFGAWMFPAVFHQKVEGRTLFPNPARSQRTKERHCSLHCSSRSPPQRTPSSWAHPLEAMDRGHSSRAYLPLLNGSTVRNANLCITQRPSRNMTNFHLYHKRRRIQHEGIFPYRFVKIKKEIGKCRRFWFTCIIVGSYFVFIGLWYYNMLI